MSDAAFAEAVEAYLRYHAVPSRRLEPRLAERLAGVDLERVQSGDGMLAAWRLGSGPAVLLVHGWEDSHYLWAPLIDAAATRGRSLVAFDMPAHGFSDGEWGFDPQATNALHDVSAALGPIDAIVSHSSGAACAIRAISEGLAVDRAVLIAPPLRGGHNRWLRGVERAGVSREIAEAASAAYEQRIGPTRAALDLCALLPALDVDVLLIHSVDDEQMPFADSQDVAAECGRCQLIAVDGLTHRRTARDPAVVDRILGFIA
jgi:pimeloyl-ACP methyl ester carboxylesterase